MTPRRLPLGIALRAALAGAAPAGAPAGAPIPRVGLLTLSEPAPGGRAFRLGLRELGRVAAVRRRADELVE